MFIYKNGYYIVSTAKDIRTEIQETLMEQFVLVY